MELPEKLPLRTERRESSVFSPWNVPLDGRCNAICNKLAASETDVCAYAESPKLLDESNVAIRTDRALIISKLANKAASSLLRGFEDAQRAGNECLSDQRSQILSRRVSAACADE